MLHKILLLNMNLHFRRAPNLKETTRLVQQLVDCDDVKLCNIK